ncbi:MAG: ABC transporter ATP-binding protein [Anaerolineales bacterium]|nr:ABC transporter ATP-binding protein [Anaerolineales bacterium]
MAFLSIRHATKSYAHNAAVEDFDLDVEKGELVSFLGPSGCGKTTTLRMVAGFEIPSSGKIELDGVDITDKPPNRRNVGMVFQAYALFPNMTVGDNISFGMKIAKKPKDEIAGRVKEMLGLIKMPDLGDRYPYQLSGGQQQRVALARALAIKPQVLLLDEPLSALDAKIRVELRFEIRRIQQQLKITTIYVTHDQEEALTLSDRVVVMSAGHIEQIGSPFDIYNFPSTAFVASFVGTLNQLRCRVADAGSGKLTLGNQPFKTSAPITSGAADVVVMLRPEELHIGVREGDNSLTGKVESVAFLGSVLRVHLKLGESVVALDALNERKLVLPKVGEDLTVSFPPHACWVMN